MIRFDYKENSDGTFNVTVVSEQGNHHSLAGRLVLTKEEWESIWKAIVTSEIDSHLTQRKFKFENKG